MTARQSALLFAAFGALAVIGFWPTYFLRLRDVSPVAHVHGLLIFGWYALLITQALLIQRRQRDLHRVLGRLSYAWAPLIVVTTLSAIHHQLHHNTFFPEAYHEMLLALMLATMVAFTLLYGQAIRHRHRVAAHARYMVATGIILLMPALVRIFTFQLLPLVIDMGGSRPTVSQLLIPDAIAGGLLLLLTSVLLAGDLRRGRDWQPFVLCLGLLVMTLVAFQALPRLEGWTTFTAVYRALPLS
jgi:hypothetical protein